MSLTSTAGPKAEVAAMAAQLGAMKFLNGEYLVPCGVKMPTLTFHLSGKVCQCLYLGMLNGSISAT